jgi:STE24 endopeptidase
MGGRCGSFAARLEIVHTGSSVLVQLFRRVGMRVVKVLLGLALLLGCCGQTAAWALGTTPTEAKAEQAAENRSAYSLPPEKLARAIEYSRKRVVLEFVDTGWGILQLILLLTLGIAAWMRNVAIRLSGNRWVQGYTFVFLLLAITTVLELPLEMYGHHVSLQYGMSVQGWGSWFGDHAKSFGLTLGVGGLLVMLLMWVIKKSQTRWWFWFWIPAMMAVVFGVFVYPIFVDPLFNTFEPLAKSNPALVESLEQVVARGGMEIPPERMYLMKASEKVTVPNAYVTGIGASKRVVVWDTTIAEATPEEIQLIFGHEMGHYVLNHIYKGLAFTAVVMLVLFWLGYHGMQWLIRRYGASWGISKQLDWAALVVLLLVISVLSFLAEPITNGFSRGIEHNADVYGQEAVHGIVGDPQAVAVRSFQVLGEATLDDPNPNRFVEFWTFNHPSTASRAAFAAAYNPWVDGEAPKYFKK